jgi:ubiquinone biosynthesis protein
MRPRWESLLDEASLRGVLPPEYVHFARPIRDGLAVFLGGLPDADQAEILRAQAGLPVTATFSQRLGRLARCSPVLQKLGQVLARDQSLALELRLHLRELESLPPTVSLETIQELLTAELGPLDRRGVTLLPPAIAEASVAVVIPFKQEGRERQGVFKVLKPGIEERLEHELTLLARVGEYLDQRCDELQIPHLDYREAFEQVRDKLLDEVQLEHEQRHLREARTFFADEPRVQIPGLFEHCTSRVTAMERVSGSKVTSHRLDDSGKKRLAGLLARALIAMPVFSRQHEAMFHGDPHAGNLFLTDDGRLAILDWSLVGRLGEAERSAVAQIILGAVTLDTGHIVAVLELLSDRERLDVAALEPVVEGWLKRIRRGRLPGLSWLVGMLDEATQSARLRVGADLMLFRKSLHTLEGVVAEVGECGGLIDRALYTEFLQRFVWEWPQRWGRLPQSRDYATRLSNLDLTRTLLSGPTAAARFWTGHTIDMLEALAGRRGDACPSDVEPEETCPSRP